jgi:hypothetical protein
MKSGQSDLTPIVTHSLDDFFAFMGFQVQCMVADDKVGK